MDLESFTGSQGMEILASRLDLEERGFRQLTCVLVSNMADEIDVHLTHTMLSQSITFT